MDAEKAFDRIEQHHLFKVLHKYYFPDVFINWIKFVYSDSKSAIIVNVSVLPIFSINRGTRQGCALSPPLSALVMEVAEAIRTQEASRLGDVHIKLYKINFGKCVALPMGELRESSPNFST